MRQASGRAPPPSIRRWAMSYRPRSVSESTLVAVSRARAAVRLPAMEPELEYPRLLPSVLIPEHAGSKRTTRDWLVDLLCILVAAGIGLAVFADAHNHQRDYPDWFTMLDLVAGAASCVAL